MLSERMPNLHPAFPLLSLMPIQIKYRFPREWRLVMMYLERSYCRNYDEEEVEKHEKISIVTLQRQILAKLKHNH